MLRVSVCARVAAIADAAYFDWTVSPEVPAGLTASRKESMIVLTWMATAGAINGIVIEARHASSTNK